MGMIVSPTTAGKIRCITVFAGRNPFHDSIVLTTAHDIEGWLAVHLPMTLRMRILRAVILLFLFMPQVGIAVDISSVEVRSSGGSLYVTTSVHPDSKFAEDLSQGLSKEVLVYIDLFRVWKIWPDEFVRGRKVTKILKSDPIKREYVAVSVEGDVQRERRFRDIDSMLGWAMQINNLHLTSASDLDPGDYFVKVTVEAHFRKLPPVVGQLLFFLPQKEFSVARTSPPFQVIQREGR
jgi:hypothetical protein